MMPEPTDRAPDPSETAGHPAQRQTLWGLFFELFETSAPAFVIALLINFFLAQATYVHGHSMEPSLYTDQRLIVEKVSYRLHPPHRGDIVVVDVDTSDVPLIKRVVGLPGETVVIRESGVMIDGVPLQEDYLSDISQRDYGPTIVPAEHVFVLGDNRNASNDSRYFGAVSFDRIIGRAWLSYWPPETLHLFR